MNITTIINIILCVLSFVLAAVSVITVIITLKQNNRMIESSMKPIYQKLSNLPSVFLSFLYFFSQNHSSKQR